MTTQIITAAAKAMFERNNAKQLTKLLWSDLTPKAQSGWVEDAKAALEEAEQERWQPINTAPKNGDDILLGCFGEHGHGMQFVAFWDDEAASEKYRWQTADGIAYHNDLPTHWQPLPEPPKDPQFNGKATGHNSTRSTIGSCTGLLIRRLWVRAPPRRPLGSPKETK